MGHGMAPSLRRALRWPLLQALAPAEIVSRRGAEALLGENRAKFASLACVAAADPLWRRTRL